MTETPTALPAQVSYDEWLSARDALLVREKAHTREGDAIAAARRRLPMTEVDAQTPFIGPDGPVPLIDVFDGRPQLLLYKHMYYPGNPPEGQCEGCTATIWDIRDPAYLNERDITFAVLVDGPWDEVSAFKEFMGYPHPWFSNDGLEGDVFGDHFGQMLCLLQVDGKVFLTNVIDSRGVEVAMPSITMPDWMVWGRQETWEDSPEGWPQRPSYSAWRRDGRPTGQWTRPGATAVEGGHSCH